MNSPPTNYYASPRGYNSRTAAVTSPSALTSPAPMASPVQDNLAALRLTPTPAENYRCPVSTPSNFVQRRGRVRRTRPLEILEDVYSQPNTGGRSHRSRGPIVTRAARSTGQLKARWTPKVSTALEYYCVDQGGDRREAALTNTHWLRALCSQPVEEILNKYRRKNDVRRTQMIWSKTFTTPGERLLLSAWDNNPVRGRSYGMYSAHVGGARTKGTPKGKPRLTRSEPPMSGVHQGGLTPSTISPGRREGVTPDVTATSEYGVPHNTTPEPDARLSGAVMGRGKVGGSKTVRGFLLDTCGENDSRVSTYTTRYFKKTDEKGEETIYTKVSWGPEQLPQLSARHKVASMLNNSQLNIEPQAPPTTPPRGLDTDGENHLNREDTTQNTDAAVREDTDKQNALQEATPRNTPSANQEIEDEIASVGPTSGRQGL